MSHRTHAAIILAAGRASRMRQTGAPHKLLLPLGGQPLIHHPVAAALASHAHPILIVTGASAEAVRAALPVGPYHLLHNPAYADGMASSLRLAIATLHTPPPAQPPSPTIPPVQGALILLGDMPLVTATLLDALLTAADAHPGAIVAPSYAGVRGSPVYFPADLFPALLTLTGDEGGRSVIAQNAARLHLLAWPDPTIALDVDHPDDYQRILALWPQRPPTA